MKYFTRSGSVFQDNPPIDQPDWAMMERAYELFLDGFRDDEVIGFGQHYLGKNFKYLNRWEFRENIGKLIEWQTSSDLPNCCFLANPLRNDYEQTKGDTTASPTSK